MLVKNFVGRDNAGLNWKGIQSQVNRTLSELGKSTEGGYIIHPGKETDARLQTLIAKGQVKVVKTAQPTGQGNRPTSVKYVNGTRIEGIW